MSDTSPTDEVNVQRTPSNVSDASSPVEGRGKDASQSRHCLGAIYSHSKIMQLKSGTIHLFSSNKPKSWLLLWNFSETTIRLPHLGGFLSKTFIMYQKFTFPLLRDFLRHSCILVLSLGNI